MRANPVVVVQPVRGALPCCEYVLNILQQEELVLVGAPEALHDDVVCPATLAILADEDALFTHPLLPLLRGVLAALVGIEYLRATTGGKRHIQSFQAQFRAHAIFQAPPQDAATRPVHHRAEKIVLLAYLEVGDVTRPGFIYFLYFFVLEKIGMLA